MARKTRDCPVPKGILVIIGGKENKGEEDLENRQSPDSFVKLDVLRGFVENTKKENPLIEVITAPDHEWHRWPKVVGAVLGVLRCRR